MRLTQQIHLAWIAAVLGLCSMLFVDTAQANQFKRIRDVNVSCSNALLCDLYITNPRVTLYSFGFRRAARPDAPVHLVLSTRDPLRSGSAMTFTVDGEEVFSQDVSAFNYRAAIYEYTYREQDDVALLLAAARRGSELQVTYATRSGQSTVPFSLSGIVAGSIFMDEVQGRVGQADSFLKLGERAEAEQLTAATSDTGVETIDSIDQLPESIAVAFRAETARCFSPILQEQGRKLGGFKVEISEWASLYGLPCVAGTGYNQSFAFWVSFSTTTMPVALPSVDINGEPIALMSAFNTTFVEGEQSLISFFKGRGLGDCGTRHRWSISLTDISSPFRLEEMRFKADCDGVYKEDDSDYVQLWPKE